MPEEACSDELAEAKAVGIGGFGVWNEEEDNVPEHVWIQVVMQCHVMAAKRVHVGALMGTQVKMYTVEFDDDARTLAEAVTERIEQWWRDHIVANKPPRLDGSEGASRMVRELVGKRSNGIMLKASAEANEAARLYFEAKRELEAAEEKKREAQNNLIAICGETDGIVGDGFRMTHKLRAAYDVDAYKVEAKRRFDMR
jgi:predicted phage-related endonuclease